MLLIFHLFRIYKQKILFNWIIIFVSGLLLNLYSFEFETTDIKSNIIKTQEPLPLVLQNNIPRTIFHLNESFLTIHSELFNSKHFDFVPHIISGSLLIQKEFLCQNIPHQPIFIYNHRLNI